MAKFPLPRSPMRCGVLDELEYALTTSCWDADGDAQCPYYPTFVAHLRYLIASTWYKRRYPPSSSAFACLPARNARSNGPYKRTWNSLFEHVRMFFKVCLWLEASGLTQYVLTEALPQYLFPSVILQQKLVSIMLYSPL
jgi:hypothetical protein